MNITILSMQSAQMLPKYKWWCFQLQDEQRGGELPHCGQTGHRGYVASQALVLPSRLQHFSK